MITKKIIRVRIQQILRKTYLLAAADKLRYYAKGMLYQKKNRKFIRQNPGFVLPPSWLAFDAYSSNHWEYYKVSGEVTVKFLKEITNEYFSPVNPLKTIYEWGCGPARIVRQLPIGYSDGVEIHASDYNPGTIEWCQRNIPHVHFIQNGLHPPLPYPDNKFDFIFGISVFTHLSERNCLDWVDELYRVLRPGGILLITTDSDSAYEIEMLPAEKKEYDQAGILVRDNYEEGKKMILTRQSPRYIREKLLHQIEILRHVPKDFPFMKQDYWIARKIS
jgi:SAM-dependent methyltransferase